MHSGRRKPQRLAISGAPCRPSKAIVVEGGFFGNSKFLTLYSSRESKINQSETESSPRPSLVRLRRVHSKPSQPDSVTFESMLSQTVSDSSLPRPNRISLCRESSADPLYDLDLEIEKTLRRLRKARTIVVHNNNSSDFVSDNSSPVTNASDSIEYNNTNHFAEPEQMENNDRTLKELAMPDVVYQPWCIQYPQLEPAQTYELKSDLIHLLPKFHGRAGEDPHKHLKEFHVVCSTMRPQGIPEDYIKMKAFPFSLDGAAKDWLYLQLILFNTWGDMKRMFLEKFFLVSRTATIRKEICGIRQHSRETLHEYWERFNKLCAICPYHQISEQLLSNIKLQTHGSSRTR
ncbi:hypothetical protein CR513_23484, partial [Mucuna pruriens]